MPWVTHVKASGKNYFYVTTYDGQEERKEKRLFSLGKGKEALQLVQQWQSAVPRHLKVLGISKANLEEWAQRIKEKETGII